MVGDEVDFGIFQIRFAQLVDIGGQLFELQLGICRFNGVRRAIRDTAFGRRRTRVDHEYADLGAFLLVCQQFGKVFLCSICYTNHGISSLVQIVDFNTRL
ncbi:hypothetical protein D3C86_2025600 [compost metagenome]